MKPKTKKILITLVSITAIYFIICTGLYFFEPADYSAPDLAEFEYYFDLYKKYDISADSEFYIKQITTSDVVAAETDKRLKYIDNTVLAVADDEYDFGDVTSLLKNYNAEICGYISDVNFYQITFNNDYEFDALLALCDDLTNSDCFICAIPDYFEETPVSEYSTNEYNFDDSYYYYDMLNIYDAWELTENTNPVNIGIIDFFVDDNEYLNVINFDEYDARSLYNSPYGSSASHGTHVAGIIGASHNSETFGVMDNANIYSYNGINVSTSYWIANLCDMIINNNVKVVNVSMAYNSYINMSASLGCENAINHIENEQMLFTQLLSNMIADGHEFVICTAAGNDGNSSVYRTFGSYFGYGDKKILDTIDIFGIFDSKPDYVDAKYSFMFSDSTDEEVKNRIIIVGSVDKDYDYSSFSNSGSIDIAAAGKYIYSTSLGNKYEYRSGTSMSTPFVSGTAALIFSINPDLSGDEVKNIIISSATQTTSDGQFTYPVLNIGEAVKNAVTY